MLNRISMNQTDIVGLQKITKRKPGKKSGSSGKALLLYFKEISKIPLLSAGEEKALGRRVRSGDQEALQKLIVSNLRFVIRIAKRYPRSDMSFQDLINQGNIGLMEAARRFDPERNVRFTSYAVWWIRQSILQYLSETSFAFRISAPTASTVRRVAVFLFKQTGSDVEPPDRQTLAQKLGVSPNRLNNALVASTKPLSLDQQTDDSFDRTFADIMEQSTFPSAEKETVALIVSKQVRKSLDILTEFEKQVLSLRFGLDNEDPLTLKDIGVRLNLSRERIRQIEAIALKKLRASRSVRALSAYLD